MNHTSNNALDNSVRGNGKGNILLRGILALILVGCIFLLVISRNWSETRLVNAFEIEGNSILSKSEIFALVGKDILKLKKEQVPLKQIESKLSGHPFISASVASFSKNDRIKIKIVEKKIIGCIIDNSGKKNMIDSRGSLLPFRFINGWEQIPRFTRFVRDGRCDESAVRNAVAISGCIEESYPDLSARIAEVGYDANDKSFSLKFRDFHPVIILGRLENLPAKLELMQNLVATNEAGKMGKIRLIDLQWLGRIIITNES